MNRYDLTEYPKTEKLLTMLAREIASVVAGEITIKTSKTIKTPQITVNVNIAFAQGGGAVAVNGEYHRKEE